MGIYTWGYSNEYPQVKKHTKVYISRFGYQDYYPCEVCNSPAVDIHHIIRRGMGGSKDTDTIDNLMALCRACHVLYGDKKQYIEFLKEKHRIFLENH